MKQLPFRLAIAATFTAEPIEPVLSFWGGQLKAAFEVRFASYNQLIQTLMSSGSEFATNSHGVNILLARLEDLAQFEAHDTATLGLIESNLHDLIEVIRAAPSRMSVPVIFVLCPSSPEFITDAGRAQFVHAMTMRVEAMLEETPGIQYLSHEEIQRLYPVSNPANPEGNRLAHIPYTDLYFSALGTALVRLTHGLLMTPFKVIALDCDYTLWRGICGEDGPEGIVLDPPRCAMQKFMVDQHEAGMLLVMASKNNEQDVLDTFEHNLDMPLQLRHFVSWRLNWDLKAANLTSLGAELSFGLDSFIFVDDNPRECAEVEESLPEVVALKLPEHADGIPHFLNHVWAFDHPLITPEDRNRNAYYAQAQQFGRELRKTASLEDFFATLDLKVRFDAVTPERLSRAAQLTQRTNQFNFTAIRRTPAEIQALAETGMERLTVEVSDRFGDYGLVGLILFRPAPKGLEIDTLLLSCRVLGRGVEYRLMARLGEEAIRCGLDAVVATLELTGKNQPARQFLHDIGAAVEEPTSSGFVYRFDATMLRDLQWKPSAPSAADRRSKPRQNDGTGFSLSRPDYSLIARTLSTPTQILEAMRQESRRSFDPAMTETEARLAGIWSDLLRRSPIGVNDNFFDLGGHSLLVVLLMVRVREAFNVELAVDDVYSANLTLGELAHRIEAYQLVGATAYDAVFREVEGMTDEEVQRLLAEDDPGARLP